MVNKQIGSQHYDQRISSINSTIIIIIYPPTTFQLTHIQTHPQKHIHPLANTHTYKKVNMWMPRTHSRNDGSKEINALAIHQTGECDNDEAMGGAACGVGGELRSIHRCVMQLCV